MSTHSQSIIIPQLLTKHPDFLLQISQNNDKVYSHIQYLKYLVESMYDMYQKMSKSLGKSSDQYEKKMSKMNDSTALSILNFIKGIAKLFQNIREQISNNTVNLSKKNQKVSKTRKDIIHQKLAKIHQLYTLYQQKVHKYNHKQQQYQQQCQYFQNIQQDVVKFYSIKDNKIMYEELQKKQVALQELLEETNGLKMELKSGLNEIRLSLKEFFEMLSNNCEDDKRLLMAVRKKLKETKIFNETIIEEVNSEAQESVLPNNQQRVSNFRRMTTNNASLTNNDLTERQSISASRQQPQCTFPHLLDTTSIFEDRRNIIKNIHQQEYCIETFCDFVSCFEKEILTHGEVIDKMRNSQEFQKFIDKKLQINELLTSDMINNTQAIKHEIADIRQILQGIKGFLNKKKVVSELKKYRAMKFEKFIYETDIFVELQKKQQSHTPDIRMKYKEQKHKFAKGHLQLMRRFRQMVQDMFRDISQQFKFQRNPDLQFKKVKNEFINKKYYSLLMLNFFVNKEDTPKFLTNPWLKNYEKYMSEENMKKIGLMSNHSDSSEGRKSTSKKWGCFGVSLTPPKSTKNQYIDEYNCALRNGIVLIQGKMKIHQNYLKFISSFNAKTFLGQTNIRVPKWDIESIEKKYVLLSLVLVVNTIHGQLSFTSFLSCPYEKLMEIYENKQPTKKIITRQNLANQLEKPEDTRYEQKVTEKTSNQTFIVTNYPKSPRNTANIIPELQEKFQSQIPQLIDKNVVTFESLSTYLSESKKELSISVQYNLVEDKEKRYFFEIKIMDKNNKIQYKFVHEKSMEDQNIKKMLEKMAADIVNNKFNPSSPKKLPHTIKKISNPPIDEQKQKKLSRSGHKKSATLVSSGFKSEDDKIFENSEYSFIERKENNQFQFDRDPSFVYVKQPSLVHNGDPSFNYVPDLQIFKNMDSEKKIPFGQVSANNLMNKSQQSDKSYRSEKKRGNEHSLTQKEIDEYLNSIDEKDIKKNLKFTDKGKVEKRIKTEESQSKKGYSDGAKTKSGFNLNHLILALIVIIGLNFIVSIFK